MSFCLFLWTCGQSICSELITFNENTDCSALLGGVFSHEAWQHLLALIPAFLLKVSATEPNWLNLAEVDIKVRLFQLPDALSGLAHWTRTRSTMKEAGSAWDLLMRNLPARRGVYLV